jgi:NAD-dependent SIR2 family protein deacetylase
MFQTAANIIKQSTAILIGAGAGIGVDSGLPDFRSREGFWEKYPAYEKLNMNFHDLANPSLFHTDPSLAWGFYGHRMTLYKNAIPHKGFSILKKWASKINNNIFIYTTNVDKQFDKAGFDNDRIVEVHGDIQTLQCTTSCGYGRFSEDLNLKIDTNTMRVVGDLPSCPNCGSMIRPNIMMFNDWSFNDGTPIEQFGRFQKWINTLPNEKLAILEIGVGTKIPVVRIQCEMLSSFLNVPVIRINLNECNMTQNSIGLKMKAIDALVQLDRIIGE